MVAASIARKLWAVPFVLLVVALMVLPAGSFLAANSPHSASDLIVQPSVGSSSTSTPTSGGSPVSGDLGFSAPHLPDLRGPSLGGASFSVPSLHLPTPSLGPGPSGVGSSLSTPSTAGSSFASLATSNLSAELAQINATYAGRPGSATEAAVARLIAEGVLPARDAYLPNFNLLTQPAHSPVMPTYSVSPAPMGIADLGLNATGPYSVYTPGVLGNLALNAYNATAGTTYEFTSGYFDGYGPNSEASPWQSGVQLNTVLTNVSFPGSDHGVFWTQNVVDFSGDYLQLIDNIWNFTSAGAGLNASTLYSYNGTWVVGAFYYDVSPVILPLSFPMDIQLYNNASVVAGRTTVTFGYRITEGANVYTGIYDTVAFNSAPSSGPLLTPDFMVNGSAPVYTVDDAQGPLYDAELVFGGPGDGSNAVINSLNGSMKLDYETPGSTWVSAPAAYDYGADTGETAIGFAGWWNGTTEYINQGPSMLYGLWNASGGVPSGNVTVSIYNVLPFSFDFFGLYGTSDANLSYLPILPNGTALTYLPPSAVGYSATAFADGFIQENGTWAAPVGSTLFGFYDPFAAPGLWNAPVYLDGPTAAEDFAVDTLGWTGGAYVLGNVSIDVNLTFNHLNDYGYPEFGLVWLDDPGHQFVVDNVQQGPDSPGGLCSAPSVPATCYLQQFPSVSYANLPSYGSVIADWFGSEDVFENLALYGYTTPYLPGIAFGGAVWLWDTYGDFGTNLTSLDGSYGFWAADSDYPTLYNSQADQSVAFSVMGSYFAEGYNLSVADLGDAVGSIGSWYGQYIDLRAFDAQGFYGLDSNFTFVALDFASEFAEGAVVDNSSYVTAVEFEAQDDSYGVVASNVAFADLEDIFAINGSAGLYAENLSLSSFDYAIALNYSAVAVVENLTASTIGYLWAINGSYGVYGLNVSGVDTSYVNVSNDSAGYWVTNVTDSQVDTVNITNGSIGVVALNGSQFVVVDAVANDSQAVAGDDLVNASFVGVLAENGSTGLDLQSVTNTTILGLTAEGSEAGTATDANNTEIQDLTSFDGSTGLVIVNGSNVSAQSVVAVDDSFGLALLLVNGSTVRTVVAETDSLGVGVAAGRGVTNVTDVTSVNGSVGVEGLAIPNLEVSNVTAVSGSSRLLTLGVDVNNTTALDVSNVTAVGGTIGVNVSASTDATVFNVTAVDGALGVLFNNTTDSYVAVVDAVGHPTYGVGIEGSSGLEVADVRAIEGATGAAAIDSSGLLITDVSATLFSNGTWLSGVEDVLVLNVAASESSNGTVVNDAEFVTVGNVSASDYANGTWINDSLGVDVWNVSAQDHANGTLVNDSLGVDVWNVSVEDHSNGTLASDSAFLSLWNATGIGWANLTLLNHVDAVWAWNESVWAHSNDTLANATTGIFLENISAYAHSNGSLFDNVSQLTIQNVTAEDGSNGTLLADASDFLIENVTAEWYSNGTLIDGAQTGTVLNTTALYYSTGTLASDVEDLAVNNTTAAWDGSTGVVVYGGAYLSIDNTSADYDATGAVVFDSSYVAVDNTTAYDLSYGVALLGVDAAWVDGTSAEDSSTGAYVAFSYWVHVGDTSAYDLSTGVNVTDESEAIFVQNTSATDASNAVAVVDSYDVLVNNTTVADAQGVGVAVFYSGAVYVQNVLAEYSANGTYAYDSGDLVISNISAAYDSVGVLAMNSSYLWVDHVTAVDYSAGVAALGDSNVSVSNVSAEFWSVAVALLRTNDSWVNATTASYGSIGVALVLTSLVSVLGVTAVSPPGWGSDPWPSYGPLGGFGAPIAAVEAYGTNGTTVDDVTAVYEPIGLFDFGSEDLVVQRLSAGYGTFGLMLNGTEYALLTGLTVSDNGVGLQINDDGYANIVTDSRFLNNTGFGVDIEDGTANLVYENDFIDNNGANATYNATHIQAFSSSPDNAFNNSQELGNYWADWHSYTDGVLNPYYVGGGAWDYHPLGASYGMYALTFSETGLSAGALWSVTVNGTTQTSRASSITFYEWPGTYAFTTSAGPGYAVSPASGWAVVASGPASVAVAFSALFVVTITASGLPSGTSWSAIFDGVLQSTTGPSLTFTVPAGTYEYQVLPVANYSVSSPSGTVTVGANYTIAETFTSIEGPPPRMYTVWVNETGLASGTSWTAVVNGVERSTTGTSLAFSVPAGTYAYQIGGVTGYSVAPSSGVVTVSGNYTLLVAYTSTAPPPPTTYTVWVNETGLAEGTSWSAIFNGVQKTTTGTSLSFTVAAGTYNYQVGAVSGYSVAPASGTATVGGNYALAVTYTSTTPPAPATYTVWINETGLTAGTSWSAIFNGVQKTTTGTSLSFTVAAGSYDYQVGAVTDYSVSPASGTATVSGNYVLAVTYTSTATPVPPTTYTVWINETGLPAGTSWSAIFDGQQKTTTGTSLEFTVGLGTFAYQTVAVSGYSASTPGGTATVSSNYVIVVSYASSSSASSPSYLPKTTFNTDWAIALGVAALAVVLALVALLRRPKAPAPAAPWQGTSPSSGASSPSPDREDGHIADGAAKGQAQE